MFANNHSLAKAYHFSHTILFFSSSRFRVLNIPVKFNNVAFRYVLFEKPAYSFVVNVIDCTSDGCFSKRIWSASVKLTIRIPHVRALYCESIRIVKILD